MPEENVELEFDNDDIVQMMAQQIRGDLQRGQDKMADNAERGAWLREHGYHKKGFAMAMALKKLGDKDQSKLQDLLRTFEPMLEIVKLNCLGNATPDMLEAAEGSDEEDADEVEPFDPDEASIDEEADDFEEAMADAELEEVE